jgi:hypothetical protein
MVDIFDAIQWLIIDTTLKKKLNVYVLYDIIIIIMSVGEYFLYVS